MAYIDKRLKRIKLIMAMLTILTLVSCEKDDKNQDTTDYCYQLSILRNSKVFKVFKFNNLYLSSQQNHDTLGVVYQKIYYTYTPHAIRKDYYNNDSVLLAYQVYKQNNENRTDTIFTFNLPPSINDSKHAYIFSYTDNGNVAIIMDKIFATDEHLDLSFKWDGNNVIEKSFPLNTGLPQYIYEYDSNPSVYRLLHAPIDANFGKLEVAEIPIASNNIKRVSLRKLVNNGSSFNTVTAELYSAQIIYNNNGYIKSEIRSYRDSTVVFDYILDTIKPPQL